MTNQNNICAEGGNEMKQEYTPLTKLLILVGLTVVGWLIVGLAVYGGLQIAIKIFGQTI